MFESINLLLIIFNLFIVLTEDVRKVIIEGLVNFAHHHSAFTRLYSGYLNSNSMIDSNANFMESARLEIKFLYSNEIKQRLKLFHEGSIHVSNNVFGPWQGGEGEGEGEGENDDCDVNLLSNELGEMGEIGEGEGECGED